MFWYEVQGRIVMLASWLRHLSQNAQLQMYDLKLHNMLVDPSIIHLIVLYLIKDWYVQ